MGKRSSKPRDLNSMAAAIVAQSVSEDDDVVDADAGKNPHAVALGRIGGKKGGAARAASLTSDERTAIARKAAQARWRKSRLSEGV